jgi:zinc protease
VISIKPSLSTPFLIHRSLIAMGGAVALSCFFFLATSVSAQAPPATPTQTYRLPEPTRVKLPNGLVILLVEKHELPLTSLTLALRTGSLEDPVAKPGVNALAAELLRKGTTTRSAEQLSDALDFMGMTFAAGSGMENTSINADFLAKDTPKALALVADMVLHPTFPDSELKKAVAQRQERLRTEKDNAQLVVGNYFLATLYANHPYSRALQASEASLGSITRNDIEAGHHAAYTPANAVLAVVGDFRTTDMEAELTRLFGGWAGSAPIPIVVPVLKPITGRHVLLVDKPDATQTYFILGNVGISQNDPARPTVRVVNTLFGGRFTSMFNDELRIKSGYSYGASSYFQEYRTPGPFAMSTFTRNATTGPAIDKTIEVLDRLHAHPFTDETLHSAKTYLQGTFPPSLEASTSLARVLAIDEVEGISRDRFNAELEAEQDTTLAQANAAIDRDFPTSQNYVLVIVGKASDIGSLAAKYGTVSTRKITDPGY